jgi:hypothetical protein
MRVRCPLNLICAFKLHSHNGTPCRPVCVKWDPDGVGFVRDSKSDFCFARFALAFALRFFFDMVG